MAAAFLSIVSLWSPVAHAAPPERIALQGVIGSLGGMPVLDGQFTIGVQIFALAVPPQGGGEQALYSQVVQVYVTGGAYSLALQPSQPGALAAAVSESPRYVQLTVLDGPGVTSSEALLPRQQLASVPYALAARTLPQTFRRKTSSTLVTLANAVFDIPGLIGAPFPTATPSGHKFRISAVVSVLEKAGQNMGNAVRLHIGPNGNKNDAQIIALGGNSIPGNRTPVTFPPFEYTPTANNALVSLSIACSGSCEVEGQPNGFASWLTIEQID